MENYYVKLLLCTSTTQRKTELNLLYFIELNWIILCVLFLFFLWFFFLNIMSVYFLFVYLFVCCVKESLILILRSHNIKMHLHNPIVHCVGLFHTHPHRYRLWTVDSFIIRTNRKSNKNKEMQEIICVFCYSELSAWLKIEKKIRKNRKKQNSYT